MVVSLPERRDRAGISLKFIIVGAGISGLGAAYALKTAGHDVLVLDKGDRNFSSRGSLQSPPNMTKVLYSWGLGPLIAQKAHKCNNFIFANGNSGKLIGSIALDEEFLRDLIADFLFIQHKDLHDILFASASREGVEIRYNVNAIDADPENVSVTLDTGEILVADVIVGADGHDSILRPVITDMDESLEETAERNLVLCFTLPMEEANQDEELKKMLTVRDWIIWPGAGYILNANLLNGGTELTATLVHKYKRPRWEGDETWSEEHDLDWFGLDMDNFEPRIQKLLKLAKSVSSRTFVVRSCPEDLVCHQSRMALIGSAAHPVMPGSNHGPALALEDSHTLGCLFSRIQNRDQISQILTAYEEIRHPRTSWAHQYDHDHLETMKVPVGPYQEQRDAILRQTMAYGDWDHMEEDVFKAIWGTELDLFAHDATEKVEDWWGQWGSILRGGTQRRSVVLDNWHVSVTQSD